MFLIMPRIVIRPLMAALALALTGGVLAHPIPDIPVRGSFDADGRCSIRVEVDPRCFEEDPNTASSLLYVQLQKTWTEAERASLKVKAKDFIRASVAFFFEPQGRIDPEFDFEFTAAGAEPLKNADDIVVLTGIWRSSVPSGMHGYRIRSLEGGKLAVLFQNILRGEPVRRLSVLFPGEDSYVLDLNGGGARSPSKRANGDGESQNEAGGWQGTFVRFAQEGLRYVTSKGLVHLLFVLGLFLLSRKGHDLLLQVTAFMVANCITLVLATTGWVHVPLRFVEPVTAATVVFVALGNIFYPRCSSWRLLIVFAAGLVHGLAFADALGFLNVPASSVMVGLFGFGVGIGAGQLALIAVALALTFWLRNAVTYRKGIVIPGSFVVAAMGIWWMVQRAGWISQSS